MELDLYQVDAFADKVFTGNPAAVCPLVEWLSDDLMRQIAEENNLSETAFFVAESDGYRLRWFTPEEEVDLCGHATLAAAHVLFSHLDFQGEAITFYTRSGMLVVSKSGNGYTMDFPASVADPIPAPDMLLAALGVNSAEVLSAYDYVVVLDNQADLLNLTPNYNRLAELDLRGVVVTAPGDTVDFVSRCFFPKLRVNEDPVTGSAHCELAPYWAKRLTKSKLSAQQLSARTGLIDCEIRGDRVILSGTATDYMFGKIFL